MNRKRVWEIGAAGALLLVLAVLICVVLYRNLLNGRLLAAAGSGKVRLVRALLEQGADANATGRGGVTALMDAARTGSAEIVEMLLARGARVNTPDRSGATALLYAAPRGHLKAMRALLRAGADPEARGANGHTALISIAFQPLLPRRAQLAGLLLAAGADVNARDSRRATTALQWAAAKADVELVRLLLDHGAAVNGSNREGFSALRWARWTASSYHALLSTPSNSGLSPQVRTWARRRTQVRYDSALEVIRLLQQHGAKDPSRAPLRKALPRN